MTIALERKSTLAVKKETSFGVDPTVASANVIEFVDFGLDFDLEQIARNVIRNTKDSLAPINGAETVAGDVSVELHGSGTAGTAPEADPLYEAALGVKNVSTASTTVAASTTTLVKLSLGGGAGFAVGDMLIIDPSAGGTGAYEVTWVVSKSTDDLTVSPALSAAPPASRAVGAGVHFKTTLSELPSLWIEYWRGDITHYKFKGNKVDNLSLDFSAGKIIEPKFSIQGQAISAIATAAYGLGTPAYDSGLPHVARYMKAMLAGTTVPLSNVSISLDNDNPRLTDITQMGTRNIVHVGRKITGSFSLYYEDKAIEDAFRAGTNAELIAASSTGGTNLVLGNTYGLRLPKIKYTKASKTKDNGMFKYDVSFEAQLTVGEDVIFTSFC